MRISDFRAYRSPNPRSVYILTDIFPTLVFPPKFVSYHRYPPSLFPPILSHSPIVDYARRMKLFFSSIGRDYRLLAAKAPRNPPRRRRGRDGGEGEGKSPRGSALMAARGSEGGWREGQNNNEKQRRRINVIRYSGKKNTVEMAFCVDTRGEKKRKDLTGRTRTEITARWCDLIIGDRPSFTVQFLPRASPGLC